MPAVLTPTATRSLYHKGRGTPRSPLSCGGDVTARPALAVYTSCRARVGARHHGHTRTHAGRMLAHRDLRRGEATGARALPRAAPAAGRPAAASQRGRERVREREREMSQASVSMTTAGLRRARHAASECAHLRRSVVCLPRPARAAVASQYFLTRTVAASVNLSQSGHQKGRHGRHRTAAAPSRWSARRRPGRAGSGGAPESRGGPAASCGVRRHRPAQQLTVTLDKNRLRFTYGFVIFPVP
jgi:hypothetical protein